MSAASPQEDLLPVRFIPGRERGNKSGVRGVYTGRVLAHASLALQGGKRPRKAHANPRSSATAVFFTIQAAAPHLNPGASIVLNGSVHAVMGVPGYSAYAATKAGVRAMTRNLASEFAPRGIRVNQVTPGGTKTPIWSEQAPTDVAMAGLEKTLAGMVALGRMGDAEEIAKAALYLASDEASYVTGAEIVVDGGATGAPIGAPVYRVAASQ